MNTIIAFIGGFVFGGILGFIVTAIIVVSGRNEDD